MANRGIIRVGFVVALAFGAAFTSGAGAAVADEPASVATSNAAKKKPKASAKQIKKLAKALGLPKSVVKRGLKGLERGDAEQEQSGPNALPPDPAIDIRYFTSFPGAAGETLFVMKLGAAPETGGPIYEYGVGLAVEGQPLSTPDPSAIAGFGRVALSRELFLEPDGEFLALNPPAMYAAVESAATALVVDVFVVFRVPDSELGAGSYYLQAFARDGNTAESPAGFTMVMGELGA